MTRDTGAVGTAAEWIATGLEAAGLLVLVLGAAITSLAFLRRGLAGGAGWADSYRRYRAELGRAILLGLELMVAADIAGTVSAPLDLRNIAALGLVVLIRTFLSVSLETEINGRFPWQGGPPQGPPPRK